MGSGAEAVVFVYIGLCTFTYKFGWSISCIISLTIIIVLGRFLTVFLVDALFRICSRGKRLNWKELAFISYGGVIRGAVAFALVL